MAPRVLVIEGSESGTAKVSAQRMVQDWLSKGDLNFDLDTAVLSGNAAAKKFRKLKDSYSVVLVLTSSFGEGDPPTDFEQMLYQLVAGGLSGERPLAGLQHAVLGFGDSDYENFQNCPRLVDKLMEECGSRRLHMRFEINAGKWSDEMAAHEVRWKNEVLDTLRSNPSAADAPVCSWEEAFPKSEDVQGGSTSKILPKSLDDMDAEIEGGGGTGAVVAVVTVGVLAVAAGAFFAFRRKP